MIVIDLEWNRSYDKKKLDEILQIGAVRVDAHGGPIRDSFNRFIKPRVHRKFDPGARKLPELQECVRSELTFREAWEDFVFWCGEERELAFWGPDDFQVIEQNCAYWDVPCLRPERVYDLQRAFAHACGVPEVMIALWRAVDYLRIPYVFDYHNALNDAMYTALVAAWLRREDLDYVPPPRKPRRRREHFSTRPFTPAAERVGPFAGEAEARNDRRSRTCACPVCGVGVTLSAWYGEAGGPFYAPFSCREHGRFLCRLRLEADGEALYAERETLPPSPELAEAYQAARSKGTIPCHRLREAPQPKKKRRKRGSRRR